MSLLLWVLRGLHLSAVVVFLGDIIVTAIWKWAADRTGDAKVAAFAARQVQWQDRTLLLPSIVVLLASGYLAGLLLGRSPTAGVGYLLAQTFFMGSGVVWGKILRPIQARQAQLAEEMDRTGLIPAEYPLLTQKWLRWGLLAIGLPITSMWLMLSA